MKNYTCAICGTKHENRDSYLKCVTNCVAKEKIAESEAKKRRLEEVNAALNRVKQAKKYFEEQLAEFEKKYPEEYKMNFGVKDVKKSDMDEWLDEWLGDDSVENKPISKVIVNGKDATKTLSTDQDLKYLAKFLEILTN